MGTYFVPFTDQSLLLSLPAVAHSALLSVIDEPATSGSQRAPASVDHTSKPPHPEKMKGKKKATGNSDSVPPPDVLGLVGSFFTKYGLESTNKAFTKELKRLQQTADWPAPSAAETVVDLQSAFVNWVEEQHATKKALERKTQPAESMSESEDATSDSESSSASSSSDDDSSDSSGVSSED